MKTTTTETKTTKEINEVNIWFEFKSEGIFSFDLDDIIPAYEQKFNVELDGSRMTEIKKSFRKFTFHCQSSYQCNELEDCGWIEDDISEIIEQIFDQRIFDDYIIVNNNNNNIGDTNV